MLLEGLIEEIPIHLTVIEDPGHVFLDSLAYSDLPLATFYFILLKSHYRLTIILFVWVVIASFCSPICQIRLHKVFNALILVTITRFVLFF